MCSSLALIHTFCHLSPKSFGSKVLQHECASLPAVPHSRRYCRPRRRIDFSVNVATSTPSWLIDALTSEIANLAAYPDADRLAAAEELIAEYHGVPPDYVMLLAGAAEGFVLLPHLPITHPTIIHPGFS